MQAAQRLEQNIDAQLVEAQALPLEEQSEPSQQLLVSKRAPGSGPLREG